MYLKQVQNECVLMMRFTSKSLYYSIKDLPQEGHFGAIFNIAYSKVSFILKHFFPPSLQI